MDQNFNNVTKSFEPVMEGVSIRPIDDLDAVIWLKQPSIPVFTWYLYALTRYLLSEHCIVWTCTNVYASLTRKTLSGHGIRCMDMA